MRMLLRLMTFPHFYNFIILVYSQDFSRDPFLWQSSFPGQPILSRISLLAAENKIFQCFRFQEVRLLVSVLPPSCCHHPLAQK